MRLNLLSDAHWESKVDRVLNDLSSSGYRDYFLARDYGSGLSGITVIFMCREASLSFKQRIRYAKSEKKLYIDIMLDLDLMRDADNEERKRIVADRIVNELPRVILAHEIPDFDAASFAFDLKAWLSESGWI